MTYNKSKYIRGFQKNNTHFDFVPVVFAIENVQSRSSNTLRSVLKGDDFYTYHLQHCQGNHPYKSCLNT